MDKLKMHTPNKADENFKKLAALFPNAVTETINENGEVVRAIDKDVLMQEISCTVVDGQWNGVSHLWNVVQTAGGYRHVDLTQPGEPVFRTDQEMAAAGYTWDSERVPVCTAEEET